MTSLRTDRFTRTATLTLALLGSAFAATAAEEANVNISTSRQPELIQPLLDAACTSVTIRELPLEEMPIAQTSHIQADCTGLDHAGAPRDAEFVFADDALAFVWVLTGAGAADAVR